MTSKLVVNTISADTGITTVTIGSDLFVDGDFQLTNGSSAAGGGNNKVFYENDVEITESYEITTGRNAMTAGPIAVNAGVTVTIPSGSVWSVV